MDKILFIWVLALQSSSMLNKRLEVEEEALFFCIAASIGQGAG